MMRTEKAKARKILSATKEANKGKVPAVTTKQITQ
jgi:hypothetical protein